MSHTRNTFIGEYAGYCLTAGENNFFLGSKAGYNLRECNDVIIIGDNILDLEKGKNGVIYVTDKILVGKTSLFNDQQLKHILDNYLDIKLHKMIKEVIRIKKLKRLF